MTSREAALHGHGARGSGGGKETLWEHQLAVRCRVTSGTTLNLRFLICEMGTAVVRSQEKKLCKAASPSAQHPEDTQCDRWHMAEVGTQPPGGGGVSASPISQQTRAHTGHWAACTWASRDREPGAEGRGKDQRARRCSKCFTCINTPRPPWLRTAEAAVSPM